LSNRLLSCLAPPSPSSDSIPLASGAWGDVVCGLDVAVRSWRQLRVTWRRPASLYNHWPAYTITVATSPTFANGTVQAAVTVPATADPSFGNASAPAPLLAHDVPVSGPGPFFVQVAVGQASAAAWSPPKVFAAGRADCECDPAAAPCTPANASAPVTPVTPAPPVVTRVSAAGPLATTGGDRIDVFGSGLGLEAADVAVKYSNAVAGGGRVYVATGCAVVEPNTHVRCASAPGVGAGHRVLAGVDGRWADDWSPVDQVRTRGLPLPPQLHCLQRTQCRVCDGACCPPSSAACSLALVRVPRRGGCAACGRFAGPGSRCFVWCAGCRWCRTRRP
jgi:hypothetical protein